MRDLFAVVPVRELTGAQPRTALDTTRVSEHSRDWAPVTVVSWFVAEYGSRHRHRYDYNVLR